jgi:hypothetical protein
MEPSSNTLDRAPDDTETIVESPEEIAAATAAIAADAAHNRRVVEQARRAGQMEAMEAELRRRAEPPRHVDVVTRRVHNRLMMVRAIAPIGGREGPPPIPLRRLGSGRPAARRAAGERTGQDPGGEDPEPHPWLTRFDRWPGLWRAAEFRCRLRERVDGVDR